jgi:hypothetical protein
LQYATADFGFTSYFRNSDRSSCSDSGSVGSYSDSGSADSCSDSDSAGSCSGSGSFYIFFDLRSGQGHLNLRFCVLPSPLWVHKYYSLLFFFYSPIIQLTL